MKTSRNSHTLTKTPRPVPSERGAFLCYSAKFLRRNSQISAAVGGQPETLCRTEEQAAALARLQSLQALYAAWPDAERIARKEDCTVNDGRLNYTVTYTIIADICG